MKSIAPVLAVVLVWGAAVHAQESSVDSAAFDTGQDLFETNCATCHQSDGTGIPPTFPALDGNGNLEDLELIVSRINQGQGAMPPFSNLAADDVTALATYIRNAWSNSFGPVDAAAVSDILSSSEGGAETVSIWSGVYTEEQAARGEAVYSGACAQCHGIRLDGANADPDQPSGAPLARYAFLRDWDGQTLSALYEYSRTTMPQNTPGALDDQQYVDVIAYMLEVSGMPPGETELPADGTALSNIVIHQEEP
ncbi:c-type cytochrome [Pelagibacterium halotolerans]|uniref:c-type cytochrome n=1 Tax=Pelagibacterium halotolerans TaxID=531813 RepID=UPI00384A8263